RHAGTGRAAGPRHAFRSHLPVHGICADRCRGARSRNHHRQRLVTMVLGSAFAAAGIRQPRQKAFVEGNRRTTYADWYRDIASVAGGPRSASGKLLRGKLRTGEYEAYAGNKITVKEDS